MGIINQSDILFLNVSCGYLVNKKKEIKARAYEGFLLSIAREEDEYEGKPINKIRLELIDDKKERASISFTEESWFSIGFFSRLQNTDMSKPITVGVSGSEKNEKISFAWMKQGPKKIDKDPDFPVPVKVQVGNKEILDWTGTFKRFNEIIIKVNEDIAKAVRGTEPSEPQTGGKPDDGLPF
jgi:hypothetical protein